MAGGLVGDVRGSASWKPIWAARGGSIPWSQIGNLMRDISLYGGSVFF